MHTRLDVHVLQFILDLYPACVCCDAHTDDEKLIGAGNVGTTSA